MSSIATPLLLPRLRFRLGRSGLPGGTTRDLLQDDAWRAIAVAVDRATADVLPLSASGTGSVVAGNRALASLVGGRFLLERIYERNEHHIGEPRTRRERRQRRRAAEDLLPYLTAFQTAISYARRIADGEPAPAKLPPLLQAETRLPLIQRFRQDRLVLAEGA
ncbi:hypothetical protein [Streptomyces sp. WM6378]|uniref:hypothetical protein n=1 Tax=Streptomyces sp. WM6378 TaxID=1415557 RepID=UPI0006B049B8|nr:hypothetical protein [Streptomyces sp. WM6378]KOU43242.1 hypothetical protein ADK54_18220 [Streptomyces sp. WM6378]